MKKIELNFEGYKTSREFLPDYHGIYFVYRVSNIHDNPQGGLLGTIEELMYIGKADKQTIKQRHANHEKQQEFDAALLEGEVLWYLTAEVAPEDIDRVENGLIFKRQPRLNDVLTESFKHPDTHFVLHYKKEIADMFTNFKLKKYDK